MSSAEAILNDPANHLPEATDEESGVKRTIDPSVVERFRTRLANADPKWQELYAELKRRHSNQKR